jgi:2,3-bisphosphoglycerate-dependent phosphoglycerate mutase
MPELVLLRHAQSLWNLEGRFTGWKDVDLSPKGMAEAREAGRAMKRAGYAFRVAYTSMLKRAIRTLWIVLEEIDLMWVPVHACWQLNERSYGALEGRSKRETEEIYGSEQVHRWRRSFRERPPPLNEESYLNLLHDPRYEGLDCRHIPRSESLEDALVRIKPCWYGAISDDLRSGKDVLVVSHGNTIRALVKLIEDLGDEEIEKVEVATGVPLVYVLDGNLRPIEHFYLKDKER